MQSEMKYRISLKQSEKADGSRIFYYLCIVCGVVILIFICVCKIWKLSLTEIVPGYCVLLEYTGYYCAGCGGTRSVMALFQGDFISCFKYHPGVFYMAGLYLAVIVSHTLNIITGNKVKAMRVRPIYFYILIAVILVQWILKDVLIWLYNIHII